METDLTGRASNGFQVRPEGKAAGTALPESYNRGKVLCMLMVVLAHVTVMFTGTGVVTPRNSSRLLGILSDVLYTFIMPSFMCMSAIAYCHVRETSSRYDSPAYFFRRKAQRLLIPYLFFGVAVVAPTMVLLHFTEWSYGEYVLYGILMMRNTRHLWFLPALFLIFVVFYALYGAVIRHPWIFGGLFLVALFAEAMLPALWQPIDNMCRYGIYFYLGVQLEHRRIQGPCCKFSAAGLCTGGLVLLLATFALDAKLSIAAGTLLSVALSMVQALCGMAFLFGLADSARFLDSTGLYHRLLADSFGIYLIHPMLNYVLFYFCGGLEINAWVLTAAAFFIGVALSMLLTELLRRIGLSPVLGERQKRKSSVPKYTESGEDDPT